MFSEMVSEAAVFSFMLILARVSALIAFFPLFTRRQIPFSVKAGLSVALSLFWFGTGTGFVLALDVRGGISPALGTVLMVREVVCGSLLGMLAGWFMIPARVAGVYIGQEMGLSMGQVLDPNGMDSGSDVGRLMETMSILLFFGLNMHHWLLLCLHHSFEFMGRNSAVIEVPTELIVGLVNQLDEFGLLVAAPVAIALAAVNFGVLYLNRASAAMNLFTVGAPARILAGLFVLVLFWPVIARNIHLSFERIDSGLQQILSAYGG